MLSHEEDDRLTMSYQINIKLDKYNVWDHINWKIRYAGCHEIITEQLSFFNIWNLILFSERKLQNESLKIWVWKGKSFEPRKVQINKCIYCNFKVIVKKIFFKQQIFIYFFFTLQSLFAIVDLEYLQPTGKQFCSSL